MYHFRDRLGFSRCLGVYFLVGFVEASVFESKSTGGKVPVA